MKTNIALIGMRGAGKTTIGKMLSSKLYKNFIDTDHEIEKMLNKTITEIVKLYGWDYFRKIETNYASQLSQIENSIISTGGGIIIDEKNVVNITRSSIIILIDTPTEVLYQRIKDGINRPALTDKNLQEELEEIWRVREEKYRKSAHLTYVKNDVDITEKDADNIIELINKHDLP